MSFALKDEHGIVVIANVCMLEEIAWCTCQLHLVAQVHHRSQAALSQTRVVAFAQTAQRIRTKDAPGQGGTSRRRIAAEVAKVFGGIQLDMTSQHRTRSLAQTRAHERVHGGDAVDG